MSLAGIRDISTINTPPRERIPVQTYVTEETEGLIRDALIRELSRGGQAFILYNRVESIYSFAKKVKDIVPEAGITVVHGQMEEKKLERHIEEFYAGKTDVLISTTIIENGVDLPRANTLVVIDADRLGLSTLYQLKGRVGRSNRMAHAYFTFKRDKVLNEAAYKRLTAIMEFTEMGSGFRIAMRDLEIRGAGNVLGKEQHYHMDKVGYELYSKLLKEELGEKPAKNVQLDIRVSAYIPEGYIENSAGRMDAYKEIAEIRTLADRNRVVGALEDLYGELPLEVETSWRSLPSRRWRRRSARRKSSRTRAPLRSCSIPSSGSEISFCTTRWTATAGTSRRRRLSARRWNFPRRKKTRAKCWRF